MKKTILLISIGLGVVALLGTGFWIYKANTYWKTRDFILNGEKMAQIKYPAKYDKVTDNAQLPNQTVGVLSIANVINFQVSKSDRDKDIKTYVSSVSEETAASPLDDLGAPRSDDNGTIEQSSPDSPSVIASPQAKQSITYTTKKYGRNTVYFIKEFNQSPDFVVGDIFDGRGHRLNFTYHTKDIKLKEIKAIISKIKF